MFAHGLRRAAALQSETDSNTSAPTLTHATRVRSRERELLATYIMMMRFTTPGIQSIREAHEGRNAGKKMAKQLGIKWKQQYLVMGQYDIITVVEAPDDETMATFALLGGMSGAFRIETMRAFTESEADGLIRSLRQAPEPNQA
jgi:uncharacterized protein with GYD domain